MFTSINGWHGSYLNIFAIMFEKDVILELFLLLLIHPSCELKKVYRRDCVLHMEAFCCSFSLTPLYNRGDFEYGKKLYLTVL